MDIREIYLVHSDRQLNLCGLNVEYLALNDGVYLFAAIN